MLEYPDGRKLTQSYAILRYLGRQYGYYPTDINEAYLVDSFLQTCDDYFNRYERYKFETNEALIPAAKAEWFRYLHLWAPAMEKRLIANGNPTFIVGNKVTIADFMLATVIYSFLLNEGNPQIEEVTPEI